MNIVLLVRVVGKALVLLAAVVAASNIVLLVRLAVMRLLGRKPSRRVSMTFVVGSLLALIGTGILLVTGRPQPWFSVGLAVLVLDPASLLWLPFWTRRTK